MVHTKDKLGSEFPIIFNSYQSMYNNTIWKTRQGYFIKILNFIDFEKVEIEFQNVEFPYTTTVHMKHIKDGAIKYPYRRKLNGGFIGVGPYNVATAKPVYTKWSGMLDRVYQGNFAKDTDYISKRNLSYENIFVCND